MVIDSPVRLTANGNGEVKCVVYAYCYEEAKRGLQPYASSIVGSYPFISAFGAQINVHALEDICRLPFVRAIAAHTTVTALDGDFSNPKTPPQSSNFSDPKTPPPTPTPTSSLTSPPTSTQPPHNGRGVAVAVIDTGIMPHLDFTVPTRRIAHFHDFISGKPDPYDDNGHGSAVAGLVIGSGALSAGAVTGSATHAEVIALKAMNSKGEGSAFRILEAMQWVYENAARFGIRVLVMSFGTAATGENDPLALGAETLWRSGITVVASAGNAGPQNGTITSPGCCSEIITVGAIGGGDRPFVPDFSSRGKTDEGKPELVAPGVDVTCCGTTKNYITLSGTSMAAPVVAGYCANILARHPSYTPDKIKEILVNSAKPLPLPPEAVGYGEARLLPEYL